MQSSCGVLAVMKRIITVLLFSVLPFAIAGCPDDNKPSDTPDAQPSASPVVSQAVATPMPEAAAPTPPAASSAPADAGPTDAGKKADAGKR
jgi:hypothetical protein